MTKSAGLRAHSRKHRCPIRGITAGSLALRSSRCPLEGVKAALLADGAFSEGDYNSPPKAGLRAFGHVYAGWAYSQAFYRKRLHRELGFEMLGGAAA